MIAPSNGGSQEFVNELLGRLGAAGGRTSVQQSQGQVTSLSVNPTIVNNVGGGSPTVTPSIYAPASGSPYVTGSSGVSEVPSFLSSSPFTSKLPTRSTAPGSSPFTSLTGQPVQDGMDPMTLGLLALGGFLLLENL